MRKRNFLVPIAVALSALASSAGASIVNKWDVPSVTTSHQIDGINKVSAGHSGIPENAELFGFVLKQSEGGAIFAGRRSHRSHRSHSSHRSHYSSRY